MALLQEGEEERAEQTLSALLEQDPEDATARLLLAQVRQPPEALLGNSFEEIEVQPGDSLSAIAGRTVGNELLFYSLARLNDVAVPRLLRPGQRLLAPTAEAGDPDEVEFDQATHRQDTRKPLDSDGLRETARRLIAQGQYSQAHALLLSAARSGKLDGRGDALLAEAALGLAAELREEEGPERAMQILSQTSPWLGAAAEKGEFARQTRLVKADLELGKAEQALAHEDYGEAFDALMAARELSDDLRDTHRLRLQRLESALGEHYHGSALSAWRSQQVDRAVELWEQVLRIRSDFEPALRYLERARRARQQLKTLTEG